jgi:ribose 5-phosphate isomerase
MVYSVVADSPKTKTSYRTLKLPVEIIDLLREYQKHQADYAQSIGSQWNESDRIFTTWNGLPMFITTPSNFASDTAYGS